MECCYLFWKLSFASKKKEGHGMEMRDGAWSELAKLNLLAAISTERDR